MLLLELVHVEVMGWQLGRCLLLGGLGGEGAGGDEARHGLWDGVVALGAPAGVVPHVTLGLYTGLGVGKFWVT